ncbi:MAG TPA: septum formation initiator family protein [Longimicrobiales bacterium]
MKLRDILPLAAVLAAAYFALFGGEYGLFEVRRLERQREAEAAELERLRADVERLRARADSLADDPAALERIARERYGMIRDGERLYRFVKAADTAGAAAVDDANKPDDDDQSDAL